mmetsp:Transcript_10443/g.13537  ORF Transcript_10443/g.13537 Transcript_10443/m.13537 type:complete len:464 (-) Transcript_10443:185-1576(-)
MAISSRSKKVLLSKIGFGAARCLAGIPEHESSVKKAALSKIITTFDTATNYGSGRSEMLIGKVLAEESCRDSCTILSKFGYFQDSHGDSEAQKFPKAFPVAPGHSYCIHPSFFHQELEKSMERLQTRKIDMYSLHNPEHLLLQIASEIETRVKHNIQEQAKSPQDEPNTEIQWSQIKNEVEGKFFDDMVNTFKALEERVEEGTIGCYGVSTNSLFMGTGEPQEPKLRWEMLVDASNVASRSLGKSESSLAAFQIPVNLLEPNGLKVAGHMQSAGLKVLGNRPLTGMFQDQVWRLLDAGDSQAPKQYLDACRDILEHFTFPMPEDRDPTEEEKETAEGCKALHEIIQDLNQRLSSFTSVLHYDDYLQFKVIPQIAEKFSEFDETSADKLQLFFKTYGNMVRYHCSQKTRELISSNDCPSGPHNMKKDDLMHHIALKWLMEQKKLDCILVGMPKENYIDDILNLV